MEWLFPYKEDGCKETWVGGLYMRRMVVRRQGVQWMDFLGVRQRFPCTGDLQPRLTISVSLIMHMHLHAMAQCSPSDTASFKLSTISP